MIARAGSRADDDIDDADEYLRPQLLTPPFHYTKDMEHRMFLTRTGQLVGLTDEVTPES